jgi:hypothetical protein
MRDDKSLFFFFFFFPTLLPRTLQASSPGGKITTKIY